MSTRILYIGIALAFVNFFLFDQRDATDLASTSSLPEPTTNQSMPLSAWNIAESEAEKLLSQTTSRETISCLVADKAKTQTVVKDALAGKYKSSSSSFASDEASGASYVPLPALNLGMPKCGTLSQHDFFSCAGYRSAHYFLNNKKESYKIGNIFIGTCMRDVANLGLPVLSTCVPNLDAVTQIDANCNFGRDCEFGQFHVSSHKLRDDCFFPQLSLLEEIHEEDPNATFLLPFRPFEDWVNSLDNWNGGLDNMSRCNLPNLPRGIPDLDKPRTDQIKVMGQFLCSHVVHVRNFVKAHPSHALIEYDLYDTETTSDLMGKLFPNVKDKTESTDCWQHISHKGDVHQGDKIV